MIALACVGLGLRVAAAMGEPWLDEITSILNVEKIHGADEVFWNIPSDNNHILNSLWIYVVGPTAPILALRLQSIACGVAAIFVAARIGRQTGKVAAILAASLAALSYMLVHYDGEARGYAGMALAILVAHEALERNLDDPSDRWNLVAFGLAICFGTLFHLTMILATGALVATALARCLERDVAKALHRTAPVIAAAALGTLPAFACIVATATSGAQIRLGSMEPFTIQALASGYAGMIRAMLGVPPLVSDAMTITFAAVITIGALALAPARRRWFPAFALIGAPLLYALARVPSLHYPRFHFLGAIGLLILLADAAQVLWGKGRIGRVLVIAVMSAILVGQAWNLAMFLSIGRGDHLRALQLMNGAGAATYGANWPVETEREVTFDNAKLDHAMVFAAEEDWGDRIPDWFIFSDVHQDQSEPDKSVTLGPANCLASFQRVSVYPYWGLSGIRWTLYQRVAPASCHRP